MAENDRIGLSFYLGTQTPDVYKRLQTLLTDTAFFDNAVKSQKQLLVASGFFSDFISPGVAFPRSPTPAEVTAYPVIRGRRILETGAVEFLQWKSGAWVAETDEFVTRSFVDSQVQKLVQARVEQEVPSAIRSVDTAWTHSTTADDPRSPTQFELDIHAVLLGSKVLPGGAKQELVWTPHTLSGAWVNRGAASVTTDSLQTALAVINDPGTQTDVRSTELGHPQDDYIIKLGRQATVSDTDTTNRVWPIVGAVRIPRTAQSTQDHSGVRGQAIVEKSGARGWGVVGMAHVKARQASGTITLTNGSANVVGVGTSFLTDFLPGEVLRVYPNGAQFPVSRRISTIQSNTQMTLTSAWNLATSPGATPFSAPYLGDSSLNRTVAWAAEFDVNNESGTDALADVDIELHGVSIASGGSNRPGYALGIYKSPVGAPFYNGLLFKDLGVYNSAIRFANINPVSGAISFADSFAGTLGISQKEGVVHEFRLSGGNAYHWGQSNKQIMSGGTNGIAIWNNARNKELWAFSDTGDLASNQPGRAIFLRAPNNTTAGLTLADTGLLAVGNKIIPTQGVAVPDTATATSSASPSAAEFNALLAELRALKTSLRNGGSLLP